MLRKCGGIWGFEKYTRICKLTKGLVCTFLTASRLVGSFAAYRTSSASRRAIVTGEAKAGATDTGLDFGGSNTARLHRMTAITGFSTRAHDEGIGDDSGVGVLF